MARTATDYSWTKLTGNRYVTKPTGVKGERPIVIQIEKDKTDRTITIEAYNAPNGPLMQRYRSLHAKLSQFEGITFNYKRSRNEVTITLKGNLSNEHYSKLANATVLLIPQSKTLWAMLAKQIQKEFQPSKEAFVFSKRFSEVKKSGIFEPKLISEIFKLSNLDKSQNPLRDFLPSPMKSKSATINSKRCLDLNSRCRIL